MLSPTLLTALLPNIVLQEENIDRNPNKDTKYVRRKQSLSVVSSYGVLVLSCTNSFAHHCTEANSNWSLTGDVKYSALKCTSANVHYIEK